jgi:membrane-bound serine protease (ClpP class)
MTMPFRLLSCVWVVLVLSVTPAMGQQPPSAPQIPDIPGKEKLDKVAQEWDQASQRVQREVDSVVGTLIQAVEKVDPTMAEPETNSATQAEKSSSKERPLVYVLPVEGTVQDILMTIFKRGLEEAKEAKADLFLLEMDTPGGELAIAEEISRTLLEAQVPTATWIKNEGLSAGMLIAISTQKIYMRKLALVGDCQPILLAPGEFKVAPEKVLTVVREYGRRAAEQNGYPVDAVLAMIDSDHNFQSADGTIKDTTGKLLTLTADQAVKIKFAAGFADSLEDVLTQANLKHAEIREFKKNWAESVAAIIVSPAIASILTLLGLAALFIEYKTPGFGFFGSVGLVLLALVFWGHAIAHLAGYEGALIFIIGCVLLGVEIFIIPGFGIFGAGGIVLMVVGIMMTLLRVPINNPLFIPEVHLAGPLFQTLLIFMGSILVIFVILKFLPQMHTMERVGMSLAMRLDASRGYTSHDTRAQNQLLGMTGKTVSQLRPGGIALIGGKRIDVVTEGDFMGVGENVKVTQVEGMRVVVVPDRTRV